MIKRGITKLKTDVLKVLDTVDIVNYKYKSEIDDEYDHIGFIADTAPDLLTGRDKNSMATGDCIGFLLAVVKELRKEINNLKERK